MGNIDKRNRLDEAPFSYRETNNNTVHIDYYGKQVKLLKGKDAEKIFTFWYLTRWSCLIMVYDILRHPISNHRNGKI